MQTSTDLQSDCRSTLVRMAHGKAILRRSVLAPVRYALLARGLVDDHLHGYLSPTTRAAGYTSDPSTFEL